MDAFCRFLINKVLMPGLLLFACLLLAFGLVMTVVVMVVKIDKAANPQVAYVLPVDQYVCTLQAGSECLEYRRMRKPV